MIINPYVTNGRSDPYHFLSESIFVFRVTRNILFIFSLFLNGIKVSKQYSLR